MRGECIVEHSIISAELGLILVAQAGELESPDDDAARGCVLGGVRNGVDVPASIRIGMCLDAIDGEGVSQASLSEVNRILRKEARPIKLRFRGTPHQAVFSQCLDSYRKSDKDRSGALEAVELTEVSQSAMRVRVCSPICMRCHEGNSGRCVG